MRVFLDFEASSLSDDSYPIEVAWVFEDGRSESHLIRPAPDWTDWSPQAEGLHRISPMQLAAAGIAHEAVAARMIDALDGHDLFASAPSWDGKWLSALLRAAGQPRHALRLRATKQAMRDTARAILAGVLADGRLDACADTIVTLAELRDRSLKLHRALPDAQQEWARWRTAGDLARAQLFSLDAGGNARTAA